MNEENQSAEDLVKAIVDGKNLNASKALERLLQLKCAKKINSTLNEK